MPEETARRLRLALLALALACCTWFYVTWERDTQKSFRLPVRVSNVAEGLVPAPGLPSEVEVRVVGPRVLLLNLDMRGKEVVLDASGAGEGEVAFPAVDRMLAVRPELKITRVAPSAIYLRLVRGTREGRK
ncbi:MAG TPA: CdaR family protein [Verrucomicrobiae bacterium]|nr:CdaR family protein [Verrucomicrobiae bacterium]